MLQDDNLSTTGNKQYESHILLTNCEILTRAYCVYVAQVHRECDDIMQRSIPVSFLQAVK